MINVYFSYDYELLWGVWRRASDNYIETNIAQANTALAAILSQHQLSKIPANIGLVGALFDDSTLVDLIEAMEADDPWLDRLLEIDERFGHRAELLKASDWLRHALPAHPQVVLGSHSHAHIFALEVDRDALTRDFTKQDKLFHRLFGFAPGFLILPKNQVTDTASRLARKFGIGLIRSNPDCALYSPRRRSRIARLLRYLDSFLPILECLPGKPLASGLLEGRFFFRPINKYRWMDHLHFWRLKVGYLHARLTGCDFHLWTHPHNFGADIPRAVANLRRVMLWLKMKEAAGEIRFCRMDQAMTTRGAEARRGKKQAI